MIACEVGRHGPVGCTNDASRSVDLGNGDSVRLCRMHFDELRRLVGSFGGPCCGVQLKSAGIVQS